MIIKDFYKIVNKKLLENEGEYVFEIDINKDHDIFNGHFPNNPVMPGVCMIQIIKEITEDLVGQNLFMEKCTNVKFMALINPELNNCLKLEFIVSRENNYVKVKNKTLFDDTLALKMSATYKVLKV